MRRWSISLCDRIVECGIWARRGRGRAGKIAHASRGIFYGYFRLSLTRTVVCLRQTPVVDDERVLDLDTAGYQTGTRLAPDWHPTGTRQACRLGVQTPPPTVFLLRCGVRDERRRGGIAMRPCRRQKGPDGIMCWDDHMAKWDVRAWSDHILIHQLPLIVNQLNGHDRCQRNLSISRTIGALWGGVMGRGRA